MAESNDPAEAARTAHLSPNPHIDYIDTHVHGYGIARFDGDEATVEFVAVDPVDPHGTLRVPGTSPEILGPIQGRRVERGGGHRNWSGYGRTVSRFSGTCPS